VLGAVRSPTWRWLVPLATSGAVAIIAVVPSVVPDSGHRPDLPPRGANSILLMLAASRGNQLSGTVVETANLGLPELPGQSTRGNGRSTLTSLLTGSHTMRIWQDGTDRQRVAILEQLGETDTARNGSTVWTYQSSTDTATLGTLEEFANSEIAQRLLRLIILPIVTGPDSDVTAGPADRIAGRDAYTVLVRPKRSGSLVDRVELSVDATQGTLLRVRLYAVGMSDPAFNARFTSISYKPPAQRLFNPVAGLPPVAASPAAPTATAPPAASPVSTTSFGWTSITKIRGSALARSAAATVNSLTQKVPGGRILATPLLSVLITDSGDFYVGAVPMDRLRAEAGL
jgi:outer membrane lipoprotein-sorting protein